MFIKRVAGGSRKYKLAYLQLVEGYRDEQGKVRHRILATLGREDELVRTGQLQRLIKSLQESLISGQRTLKLLEKHGVEIPTRTRKKGGLPSRTPARSRSLRRSRRTKKSKKR